jgi:hypothetical protein
MKCNFQDHLYSGTSFRGILTIEDLIECSNIVERQNTINCHVDRDKLYNLFEKRSSSDSLYKDFDHFANFVFDEPIIVENTYFNSETKKFETQEVRFILESE